MALNAIKAPLVEYDNDNTISVNGATVQINGGGAKFVTTTIAKQQNISDRRLTNTNENIQGGYTVEFGERYLPKLELKKSVDVFGRPSYTWFYDKEEIGTYVDVETLYAEFTTEVTGKDLYDVIGKSIMDDDDYKFIVTIDGIDDPTVNKALFDETAMNKNNKKGVGDTGNGTLTQVFVDSEKEVVRVAIINTYLARAKGDYSEKKDEVTFNVYAIDKDKNDNYVKVPDNRDNSDDDSKALTVSGEDFYIADVKEDDAYLVTVAEGAIQTLAAAEVVGDVTLTAFKKNSNVVADGMIVDSIGEQFVTIRAEGNTDIPTTTVRTNAYVDDSTLPGYGLSFIQLDGEPGTKLQLAGNIKEVLDLTPKSDLQVVQGSVDKITIDETPPSSSRAAPGWTSWIWTWAPRWRARATSRT